MKSYGSFCPICGKRNEGLMLEETDGALPESPGDPARYPGGLIRRNWK